MIKNVTVDEALSKGHKMVTWPVMFITFGVLGITIYAGIATEYPSIAWPVGIVSMLVFPWLYWSFRITKWRVWAFDNVRNVHELKMRAIEEKLIWPDESRYNKTEIWSDGDKERWALIQLKFQREDVFIPEEDPTVPPETVVEHVPDTGIFIAVFHAVLFTAFGVFLVTEGLYIYAALAVGVSGFRLFFALRKKVPPNPPIILNDKGIQSSGEFHEWKDISNEDVEQAEGANDVHYYLTYINENGTEYLSLDDYNIGGLELRRLLKIYRSRNVCGINPYL